MDQKQVEREKMEALQALASTNMKVSEARNALISLQEAETDYLIGREARAMVRIDAVLKDSQVVLETISKNYADSANLSREVTDTIESIFALLRVFREVKEKFTEKCDVWDKAIGLKEGALRELEKHLNVQSAINKNEKEALKLERKRIAEETRKLADDRAVLERAITRLKEGRI